MERSQAPLLALQRVGHIFDSGTTAVEGIDLSFAEGSFISLVGPSGCGKSTLLRIAAGLMTPSKGDVQRNFDRSPGALGFVFQDPTLMPWATALANVRLPLDISGRSGAQAAAATALARVGLAEFTQAYPRQLSGGMRMRVSIARAIATDPKLLLMDEPFAALDEFTRFKLNDDLLALWQANRWTVVFVTHSVREAVFLSQRVVVMSPRPGRIAADLAINLPAARAPDLRQTHAFADECARVTAALSQVMEPGSHV
ncbi:MAG: ABC transporter ATP-binding protein [Rhodospirillaceae bacterium]|nr:ABC transporter ATP-binding protein [Rhodospirillaceae bacterium]